MAKKQKLYHLKTVKYTSILVKKSCKQVQLLVDTRQIVVSIIIMHMSGQSFRFNKQCIIINIVNWSTWLFQLIAKNRKY